MKSSQAWGFLLSPSMTGPYSCGSSPYCDMISPISAASGMDDQSRIQNTNGSECQSYIIHTHQRSGEMLLNLVASMYQCLGQWWSPPAPFSSPACNDLPRSGPQGTYHMVRKRRIRNSESCVSGTPFLIENNVVFVLFSTLLGLKVVMNNTKRAGGARERGPHTCLSPASFCPDE